MFSPTAGCLPSEIGNKFSTSYFVLNSENSTIGLTSVGGAVYVESKITDCNNHSIEFVRLRNGKRRR